MKKLSILGDIAIDLKSKTPIYMQIADIIGQQIEKGMLEKDAILPSINVFNEEYNVARDTIEKAYKELKRIGYVNSVRGKGYFVVGRKDDKLKILFIFNKISSFKRIIYYSFLNAMGDKATVDLQIHHYKPSLLKDIFSQTIGKYNYYLVMPHFEMSAKPEEYVAVLKTVPPGELILVDKILPEIPTTKGVYQDFKNDIYKALTEAQELIAKYKSVSLLFPDQSNHPLEIIQGAELFCKKYKHSFKIISKADSIKLVKGTLYIVIAEDDLVVLVKKIKQSSFLLGKDIGIISFNETELKDLLDITVISTDFEKMGESTADLILNNRDEQIKNPFYMIKRRSL
ncbi:GntR family transcriptional regulator [Parasediminibacterium sp. JCM 36343]|uniref:GntR family transcriptional regulator n=1 Tax=Parasediminibacterium sp. JCM 36343 TaxID=3374279 RepID=UPI00397DF2CD